MTYVRSAIEAKNERYTPQYIIDIARATMGRIDLDPTTSEAANAIIQSNEILTTVDDAYNRPWGSAPSATAVWFNPPYGSKGAPSLAAWVNKWLYEYEQGHFEQSVGILPAFTAQKWFLPLWQWPICFLKERVKFIDGNTMLPLGQPMYAHCLVYLPPKDQLAMAPALFSNVCQNVGTVVCKV
jgi:ParB family chromosome partitioning protein